MKKFRLHAKFYGREFYIDIIADNEFRADMKVRERLIIDKIELVEEVPKANPVEFLKDIFGMK